MDADLFDLAVIGGGINGAGIARDAAGRGLKVLLCDKGDLGGATSSASSKLIHGGLRYLEHGEFGLVRSALKEREVLLRAAPHLVSAMRFVLPHNSAMRPAWMIRLGLFLYDRLGGASSLPRSRGLNLAKAPEGEPLKREFTKGFEYADCWVDDARLVLLTALDAKERGAAVLPRVACTRARVVDGLWYVTLSGPPERIVRARALVNAAGPWADDVSARVIAGSQQPHLKLVQGSHIVLPRLHDGDQAYILQNPDERIVFVLPFEERYSLIGTTDTPIEGEPGKAKITDAEIDYLLKSVGAYFRKPVGRAQIVWSFAGVRPLYDDGSVSASTTTRDYVFDLDTDQGAPLLTVYGGKLTTFRKLAEHAMEKLGAHMNLTRPPWTASAFLPGGNIDQGEWDRFMTWLLDDFAFLPKALVRRYAHAYGTRAYRLLHQVRSRDEMGAELLPGLYEREVDYLRDQEWAKTAEDVLWRRTKLGLGAPEEGVRAVRRYMGA